MTQTSRWAGPLCAVLLTLIPIRGPAVHSDTASAPRQVAAAAAASPFACTVVEWHVHVHTCGLVAGGSDVSTAPPAQQRGQAPMTMGRVGSNDDTQAPQQSHPHCRHGHNLLSGLKLHPAGQQPPAGAVGRAAAVVVAGLPPFPELIPRLSGPLNIPVCHEHGRPEVFRVMVSGCVILPVSQD